jgi:tetratricopeptide (TPR) repeat protein
MPPSVNLSADELFHLAVSDSRNGRHGEAILKLKQCIAERPDFAEAFHMLGAEHAEIGMYTQAVQELQQALSLNPSSVAARFQLGLLHAISGNPTQARHDWAAIDGLDPDGPWSEFKGAMEKLLDGKTKDGLRRLEHGLQMDFTNEALRSDMLRLKERIEQSAAAEDKDAPQAAGLLRSTYGGNSGGQGQ